VTCMIAAANRTRDAAKERGARQISYAVLWKAKTCPMECSRGSQLTRIRDSDTASIWIAEFEEAVDMDELLID
jgi:hypothetical protein